MYKALSVDSIMRDHFTFFAIDSPDPSLRGGLSLPAIHGMLVIDEQNPSPRVFHLEGSVVMQSYDSTVSSLIQ
jgi:hypothetical protein